MTEPPAGPGTAIATQPTPSPNQPVRRPSLDAYRGWVMFLMMAEVLHLPQVAEQFPQQRWWQWIAFHTSHVAWVGCSLHDLIQPSFSFLVGVALPFSLASRYARGQSFRLALGHAMWRAMALVGLGVLLRSFGKLQIYWTFEDTLSQIGLGYLFLFLLGHASPRLQWGMLGLILVGYWLAFACYPLPAANFPYEQVGITRDWQTEHQLRGFAGHWNKNTNAAWAADRWLLNQFPRESPFVANRGGYATLSFIPTLGTMLLGLIAGRWLRGGGTDPRKLGWLVAAGFVGIASGWMLNACGVCPLVKRIWTPSWVLYSGGWCFVILSVIWAICEVGGWHRWAFPLIVVGANSIGIYCLVSLTDGYLHRFLVADAAPTALGALGPAGRSLLAGSVMLVLYWSVLYFMYRRRIFLRI